jgi:hypothetical protein
MNTGKTLFALCHERRNLTEYEGYMDVDEALFVG